MDTRKGLTISLRITPALKLRLDRVAQGERRTVSNLVTLLVEEGLARREEDRAGE